MSPRLPILLRAPDNLAAEPMLLTKSPAQRDRDRETVDRLGTFKRGGETLPIPVLTLDGPLVRAVQDRLAWHGLLDPWPGGAPDGFLGPVTQWALCELCRTGGQPYENGLTPRLADLLLSPDPILPLHPGDDLAGRVVSAMLNRGEWVSRHADCFTIVYAEGIAPDGHPSAARPDAFDDARFLIRVTGGGRPEIAGAWEATTAPGRPAVEQPAEPAGAPWLQPGQYKAWVMGRTAIGTKLEQDALVQAVPLPVTRDEGQDFRRRLDRQQTGQFVIDQHGGFDAPSGAVGGVGAGCLVGRLQDGHRTFIATLRTDPRWRVNHAYRFMSSILPANAVVPVE